MIHLIIVMALWAKYVLPEQSFSAQDLSIEIPDRFLQILDAVVLEITAPNILHSVTQAEVHVFGDLDTLDLGWVTGVVGWVVYVVAHTFTPYTASQTSAWYALTSPSGELPAWAGGSRVFAGSSSLNRCPENLGHLLQALL